MPIGGFVVMVDPKEQDLVVKKLKHKDFVEVYGSDKKGNIVIVIDTHSSDEMEDIVKEISLISGVLSVGLTYLHAEDEVERIEKGEYIPKIKGRQRGFLH